MLRSALIVAGAALLCSVASAQNKMSGIYPVKGKVHEGGVYDLSSGKYYPRNQAPQQTASAVQTVIYNNTCFWGCIAAPVNPACPGTWFWYGGHVACEDWYDEGRIPASGPVGSGPDNAVNTFQFAYCSAVVSGTVDVDWAMIDTNAMPVPPGIACLGGALVDPITPATFPAPAPLAQFLSAPNGFPLPGSTNPGVNVACWIITLTTGTGPTVCVQSGAGSTDFFSWRTTFNNTVAQSAVPSGDPLMGDPAGAGNGPGSGSYNIPAGVDRIVFAASGGTISAPCGTGLDTQDAFWLNTDGSVGTFVPPACAAEGAGVSGCYFFGGYTGSVTDNTPFSSFWEVMEADGGCTCNANITEYCTAKVTSTGCTPDMTSTGTPSISAGSGFVLTTALVPINKNGLYFWGTAPLGAPFQGGYLCVKAPQKRLTAQNSGSAGPACGTAASSGSFVRDFNTWIATHLSQFTSGQQVNIQCWFRDPASPSTTGLSEGRQFNICP